MKHDEKNKQPWEITKEDYEFIKANPIKVILIRLLQLCVIIYVCYLIITWIF